MTEPPLIVGAWQISRGHHHRPLGEADAFDALAAAADRGFTTLDCADIYTGVEELLGRFRRWYGDRSGSEAAARLRIHTKWVPDRDALPGLTRRDAERAVDTSLRRLGVERLDLVQFAWWEYAVPRYVEAAGWLQELQAAGKIRAIGATNFDAPRLRALLEAGIPIRAHQVQYSLLDRRPAGDMTALCAENGVRLVCYGTLAGGLLTDRWVGAARPGEPLATRSLRKYLLIVDEFGGWEALQAVLARTGRWADTLAATRAQVAVAWVLRQTAVGAAIVGLTARQRMEEVLDAAALGLPEEAVSELSEIARDAPGPSGPVFGLERIPGGPHAAIMKHNLHRDEGAPVRPAVVEGEG